MHRNRHAPDIDGFHECGPGNQAIEYQGVLNDVLRGPWARCHHARDARHGFWIFGK